MTLLFNVTDAIGVAPNHGITRTERRLAGALLGRPDVHFVAVRDGRLWRVEDAAVERSAAIHDTELVPVTERFGVDPPPRSTSSTWSRIAARSVRRPAGPAISLSPCQVRTDDTLVSVGLDWVHGTIDVAERVVFGNGGRFVGMSYDLIPIDHPEWLFPPDPSGFRRYLQRLTRSAHRVLCISECTQRDLLRHAPDLSNDRAPVIRLGADAATTSTPDHDRFARSLFAGEPYAVYCATLDRRKNHEVLYRTMRRLVARGASGNLVFVGRTGSGVDDLVDCLRHDRSIAGRIAHVTDCDDQHLAALYRNATCAVYPSLYEGWGLGVTEALAHGKPCLIASGSSLGEAGLGVCTELHPLHTAAWADALERWFTDPPVLPSLELPTWESAADRVVEVAA